MKGDRRRSPSKHCDKNMERQHRYLILDSSCREVRRPVTLVTANRVPSDNLLKHCALLRSRRTSEEITTLKFLLSVGDLTSSTSVGFGRGAEAEGGPSRSLTHPLAARPGWPLGAGRGSRTAGASRAVAAARTRPGGCGHFLWGPSRGPVFTVREAIRAGKPVAPRSPRVSGDAAEAADRVSPSWHRREVPGRDRANAKS